ncbi:restriction endonuclease subunit S [Frischella perrara]|uniref:Restriction endonuclease subunit S n=1 Tax=Frischella perrara TaxID=1267021 RepID=A0A318MU64_FRIPE|nr:restriction endonuclease subunit S [Frischella perrara]PXY95499.1 restriction endonuclease subunit S [Frischella perrara]
MANVILSDVIDIISGGTPKTSESKYWSGGNIDWLSINDFNNGNRFVYSSEKKITELALKESNIKLLNKGDVIISARGTVGVLAQIGKPMCFNQSCFGLRGKKELIDNDFLYYVLKNYIHNLKKKSQGSVFDTINIKSFDLMEIDIPNYASQCNIASVLSVLDQKIELNNRINAELEAMAKTLYDYWFVQFDFPNEDGKPYKSSGGKMVYNNILKREIPEGWEIGTISEFIASSKGGDWGKETIEGKYTMPVICVRGADINGLNGSGQIGAPKRYILDKNKEKFLLPYDLVIEISGGSPTQSTGRLLLITDEMLSRFDEPLICSNFCKAISLVNHQYAYNFKYMWDSIYDSGVLFGWEGKTSGIKNLLFESFVSKYIICMPAVELVNKFFSLAEDIHKKKQNNLKENEKIIQLRDFLLPMLMNGQVTVK